MQDPLVGILGSLFAAVTVALFKCLHSHSRLRAEAKSSKIRIKDLEDKIQSLEAELLRKQDRIDNLTGGDKAVYQQKAITDYDPFDS